MAPTPLKLRCPRCSAPLPPFACACGADWPEKGGIRHLVEEAKIPKIDRTFRSIYDHLGWGHDGFVSLSFPLLLDQSEDTARGRILAALDLHPGQELLEVGAGSGGMLPWIHGRRPARHVAVDLSPGMLRRFRRRPEAAAAELYVCDAHALPFADDSFDRVMQIGAINAMGDPSRAIAEMTRVCRPGGRVLLADEALSGEVGPLRRLIFRALTVYDADPHPPLERLPPEATDIRLRPLNDWFYLLSFGVRKAPPGRSP